MYNIYLNIMYYATFIIFIRFLFLITTSENQRKEKIKTRIINQQTKIMIHQQPKLGFYT